MCFKSFTRFFLLIGMLGLFSLSTRADEIQIGSGTSTDSNLPTHSYYKYSLTQQIYTAAEIEDAGGGAGIINSIAFYNGGSTKTRNFSIYLVNTDKESFSSATDWITVTTNDLVFSGEVEMTAGAWKTIVFDNAFSYDGGNLAVVVDDNTGNDVSGMSCLIYTASSTQSIYYRNDYTNPDPTNPTISGTPTTNKNQIILDIETAAVTCAKPKYFTATGITAHSATLTWTAGADGQSDWDVYLTQTANDVPDESTTPTYQVTECTKALTDLSAQTTYYAYVRTNCGGGDLSNWANKTFTTTREALTVDENHPYAQDFESSNDWGFTNGTQTNQWCWGSATNNGGEKAMYVSNDEGVSNAYTLNSTTVVFASKLIAFTQGTYTFMFDWKAYGESNSGGTTHYDYLRVVLVPGDVDFTAGSLPSGLTYSATPSSWIALDGGHQLDLSSDWQTQTAEATVSGTYTLVFVWRNDSSGGDQSPAAIDNINISYMTCPRPTNLTASNITGRTATLSWTENGTATDWVLQYATNNSFTENLVETSTSSTASMEITGLSSETTYYARVKAILGNQESSWSDACNFTTIATCEKPTLSYVTNSNTAHTGSVSWTGTADNYELIYSTQTSFGPGEEGVTQIDLGNVNTYTLENLAPETTYRIKVRANCGEEDGFSAWSNQVSFTTTATCIAPSSLSASATSTTITFNWTAGEEGQDAWDIRYKASSESEYTYIHLDNQTETSYTITCLFPVTTYNLNVRAYCSEDDQSKWGYNANNQSADLSITTDCAALTLPYTCDFEGALETSQSSSYPMPKCWTRKEYRGGYYGSYTYYPSVREATSSQPYAHGGNGESATSGKSLHFYKPSTSTDEAAVLPELDEQYLLPDLQISFWARLESYQTNKDLSIGVMTDPDDLTTFTEVATITVKDATFQEYTAFFEDYDGDGHYIAIRFNSNTSGYIFVDDITIDDAPRCFVPKDLEATAIDIDNATLTWTAGKDETAWNVQYKLASDSEWSDLITVNETTCTLTGLQRAKVYEARVQANCNAENQSDWTYPITFTTECGVWPIDAENSLSENFDDMDADFPPICWTAQPSYNGWGINFNNAMVNDQPEPHGAAHSGTMSSGLVFLILPPMHIEGNATLSFDQLFGTTGEATESSIAITTLTGTFDKFTPVIWSADENNLPTTRTHVTVSLADYDGRDIQVAFKYDGNSTSSRTWYIDNVEVSIAAETTSQTIELVQGWNWISTYIAIDDPEEALLMLQEGLGENGLMIKTKEDYTTYEEGEWGASGDLLNLDNKQMYMIQVATACTVELEGTPANPSEYEITITPGWNWIGFPSSVAISLEDALADFDPEDGDQIKNKTNYSTFDDGEWGATGDLETLNPGEGLMYYSNSDTPKILVFSSASKGK